MQALFKTVAEKAIDCNELWDNTKNVESLFANPGPNPMYNVVSELIISVEIIEKSFDLFGKGIKGRKNDFYYLFWKQLRTGLRGGA